ncbi:MAG: hypothetical protein ACRCXX_07910 [Cetobacterium sp.]|uniref:hypothetical protein n=1 Tax=Cetobacterium sp. TaxID=2071632 RepID=UPI003F395869
MEKFTIMQGDMVIASEVMVASKEIKDMIEVVNMIQLDERQVYEVYPKYSQVASHTITSGEIKEIDPKLLSWDLLQRTHLLGNNLGTEYVRNKTKTVSLHFGNRNIGDAVKTLDLYDKEMTVDEIFYHLKNSFNISNVDHVSVYHNGKFKICIGFDIVNDDVRVIYVKNTPTKYYIWRQIDKCCVTSKSRISRILGNIVLQGAEK